MTDRSARRALLGAAVICALFSSYPTMAAEEGTVEAFSSWQARGQIYPTGPNEGTFVGALSGVLYVKGDDDSLDAGLITCPATVLINTEDGSQTGHGKCVILTPEAERIYAEFRCSGVYLEGCNGDFTLKGGTGKNENISGGGPIRFKSAFSNLAAVTPGSVVEQSAVGVALWPKLTYRIP
jgi:hypothetical protein